MVKYNFFWLSLTISFFIGTMNWVEAQSPKAAVYEKITFEKGLNQLLARNAKIFASNASLMSFKALRQEAYGAQYPTLSFLTFVAPIFEAKGDALSVQRNYKKWGPIVYGQAQIQLPVFTFGRIANAKKASDLGIIAGKSLHEAEINKVIFDYKKIYLSLVLLKRFKVILDDAAEKIGQAVDKATESYNTGEGTVKKKDIVRLKLFALEQKKLEAEWRANKQIASLALGHFLGKRQPLDIEDGDFPEVDLEAPALNRLVTLGFQDKPEWRAVKHGIQARKLQVKIEEAGKLPVFFIAAQGTVSYSNVRERQDSPFANDPFNARNGAIVLGAQWKFDFGATDAKITRAKGELNKLQAAKKEAVSGIPFLISKAYYDLNKFRQRWLLAQKQYKESSKWSLSEWTAYSAGVGEAKDLLESLGAFFQARKDMAEAEFNYVLAWAQLSLEVGRKSMLTNWKPREDE